MTILWKLLLKKKVNYLEGFFAGPLLSKKYLSDVAVKDLAKSDKIRKHQLVLDLIK